MTQMRADPMQMKMKTILSLLLVLWLGVATSPAPIIVNSYRFSGGGGAPPTLQYDGSGSFDDLNDFSFYTWLANNFVSPGTFTCTAAKARLSAAGTIPAGTLTLRIYTSAGGNPGVQVGTASANVDRTTVSGGDVEVDFTGLNASLTNGTTYFVVLQASSTDGGNSGNSVRWIRTTDGTQTLRGSTDGTAWDNLTTGKLNVKLYGN